MSRKTRKSKVLKTYECLNCGKTVEYHSHPLKCADCGGLFHEKHPVRR